jgi:hypothetical protein
MNAMCHNMIGVDMPFTSFRQKIRRIDVNWVQGLICYFCIPQRALRTFLYYMKLIADRCDHID